MEDNGKQFSYSGMLVFNHIYKTSLDRRSGLEGIEERLPRFEKGTAREPGEGFEIYPLSDYKTKTQAALSEFMPEGESEDYFGTKSEEILRIKYGYESFESNVEAVVDGERKSVAVVETNESNFYWSFPDYLMQHGKSPAHRSALKRLKSVLSGVVEFEEIRFDSDFFLWVLYQAQRDGVLDNNLAVKKISDVTFREGEESTFGNRRRVSGREVHQSHEVMKSILTGSRITSIGGDFLIDGRYNISAELNSNGKVHVKAKTTDIREQNDFERMLLSTRFVDLICTSYTSWEELGEEKSLPEKFYRSTYENLRDSGVEIGENIEELVEKRSFNDER